MDIDRLNWFRRHSEALAIDEGYLGLLWAALAGEEARQPTLPKVSGTIALMPLTGLITQRPDWFGGTSTDAFGRGFTAAMANENIAGVVIDVDSPGGLIYGVDELSERIFKARGTKPVVAVANSMAASAAYWIASAAEKFVVMPHGDVGSIGVWAMHQDWSKYEEDLGIKTTLVSSGKFKVEGNPWSALDEEAKSEMQKRVDSLHEDFIGRVAENRGVRASAVRSSYGQGRLVPAKEAVEAGMVDGIMSLDDVLRGMVGTVRKRSSATAALDVELEQALHAAYLGAGDPEDDDEDDDDDDTEVERSRQGDRRKERVRELNAWGREQRLREMEAACDS